MSRESVRPGPTAGQPRWWAEPWEGGSRATLFGIIIFGFAVRVYLFRGYVGLDDAEYARFAYQLAHGVLHDPTYTGPAVFPLRTGVTVPTAVLFRLLGMNEWTMVLYPLLLSFLSLPLMYRCASLLFGAEGGLIAAGLLSVFPWDLDSATKLLPDLPAAFYAALAVTVLLDAMAGTARGRRRMLLYGTAAGVSLGVSWLCKESVAYLAPFFGVWMIITLRREGRAIVPLWAGVAAGSLFVLLGEAVYYHQLTGDTLFRFHEVERNYRQWENSFFTEGSAFGFQKGQYGRALVNRLFVSGPAVILLSPTFLYLPLIGLVVSVYAWIRRDTAFLVPGLWLCSLILMFNFGSSSMRAYLPLALFHRYLYPIFFPAILLTSGFLSRTVVSMRAASVSRWKAVERSAGLAALLFVCWVGARQLWFGLRNRPEWLVEVRSLRSHIVPSTIIYSDALSLRMLEFLNGFPARTAWTDLRAVAAPSDLREGSLILVNPAGIEWLDRNAGMWVSWPAPGPTDPSGYLRGSFYKTPPRSWKLVWHQRDVLLYRVTDSTHVYTIAGDTER